MTTSNKRSSTSLRDFSSLGSSAEATACRRKNERELQIWQSLHGLGSRAVVGSKRHEELVTWHGQHAGSPIAEPPTWHPSTRCGRPHCTHLRLVLAQPQVANDRRKAALHRAVHACREGKSQGSQLCPTAGMLGAMLGAVQPPKQHQVQAGQHGTAASNHIITTAQRSRRLTCQLVNQRLPHVPNLLGQHSTAPRSRQHSAAQEAAHPPAC